jgi:hypothetical protein
VNLSDQTTGACRPDVRLAPSFSISMLGAIAKEIGSPLPPTWTAETPRGGRHLYFALPGGEPPGNRTGLLLDVRSEGGYVVVPPSILCVRGILIGPRPSASICSRRCRRPIVTGC